MEDIEKDLSKKEPVTIPAIRDLLHLKWQRNNARGGRSTANSTTSDEQALFVGGFKGKCGNCGKFGHKQSECRSKVANNTNSGGNNTGTSNNSSNYNSNSNSGNNNTGNGGGAMCNYCKQTGHWKNACPA